MKTPQELARMYEAGALDEVARECMRYGAILADKEDSESLTRWRIVWHAGKRWEVEQVKGEIRGLGWLPAPLPRNEARAVALYGLPLCLEAFRLYESEKYGAGNIAFMLSRRGGEFTTRQGDALINAGRAIRACAGK